MVKVGIVLDSLDCHRHLFLTVSELAASQQVELHFLVNRHGEEGRRGTLKDDLATLGLAGTLRSLGLKALSRLESFALASRSPKAKDRTQRFNLAPLTANPCLPLRPLASVPGGPVRYGREEVAAVQALGLDLLLQGHGVGPIRGEMLKAAKDGCLALQYGDDRWNRSEPAAFWEVYLRKPSTGFTIQRLSDEPEGGAVLFRGDFPTRRTYAENAISLFDECNPYLAKLILDYARTGVLPAAEEKVPFDGPFLAGPSLGVLLGYLMKTQFLVLMGLLERLVLRRHRRWGVAFYPGGWRKTVLSQGIRIPNPPNRFFADPFVIARDGRTICFVEDYCYARKRGGITAIELNGEGYRILGPVLEEPFHLSFPFLLPVGDELYMVPETAGANAIRLYKCLEFPMKWEFQQNIMTDCSTVDSMIFQHQERWWMLTNMTTPDNSDHCSRLFAFHSDHPFNGPWQPHPGNPLLFDSATARNGGILDLGEACPVRVRQKQGFNAYGSGATLARIQELSPTAYREQEIGQLRPRFFPGLAGCHHMHSNGQYTVYDFIRPDHLG